jgi:hypothetical protein
VVSLATLDLLYELLEERGDVDGIQKIREGTYFVRHNGWF